jgi:two-component system, LytTR family, response regulator
MSPLRVVVVDDEQLAREGLAELLEKESDVVIAGTFGDGISALKALDSLAADALFVDIQMPGMSGLELVELLDLQPLPAIVFVTAYDAYAIRAFEVNAMDYVLKPATPERLRQSLDRIRARRPERQSDDFHRRLAALLDGMVPGHGRGIGRLIAREVGQVIVIATRDVDWIEGADYYAKLHVGGKTHLLRETLTSLEQRLDRERFMRINRSTIINLTRVRSVETHQRGEGMVVLASKERLKVTAQRREELERRLEALHDTT